MVNRTKIKYSVSEEEFIQIVKNHYSVSSCIRACNLVVGGANYRGFWKRVKELNLDTDHFTGQGHLKGKNHNWSPEISIEKAFVENGSMQSRNLKNKILKHNLKDYKCENCGINKWLDKDISLQLDHINGVNNDNRLENLRFLCPNCHSQTPTFCRKKSSLSIK